MFTAITSPAALIYVEVDLFSKLRNLGPASSQMLLSAGILSEAQLREMGFGFGLPRRKSNGLQAESEFALGDRGRADRS